jgi:hypothetical protein
MKKQMRFMSIFLHGAHFFIAYLSENHQLFGISERFSCTQRQEVHRGFTGWVQRWPLGNSWGFTGNFTPSAAFRPLQPSETVFGYQKCNIARKCEIFGSPTACTRQARRSKPPEGAALTVYQDGSRRHAQGAQLPDHAG